MATEEKEETLSEKSSQFTIPAECISDQSQVKPADQGHFAIKLSDTPGEGLAAALEARIDENDDLNNPRGRVPNVSQCMQRYVDNPEQYDRKAIPPGIVALRKVIGKENIPSDELDQIMNDNFRMNDANM